MDRGRAAVLPVVGELSEALPRHRTPITTGAGIRARHVLGVGPHLGLPTGALAGLAATEAEQNGHMIAALLAADGVSYVAHETAARQHAAHLTASRAIVSNGYPPYGRHEFPPAVGKIPVHRGDAGTFLLADAHGAATPVYVKDVDAVDTGSGVVGRIGAAELLDTKPENLPVAALVLSLVADAEHVREIRVVDGLTPAPSPAPCPVRTWGR
ncbi:molybdenum storage protein subunit alpha [Pseudonocardia sp. KRD-184]|uniref:Molybdenum storage protein subunit alpha n=1 Tax=Pseudonocardia oceani TaxID=2792013 RepID=A0ABS6UCW8_9PSEU|nr:molybdenum storage protein subunit alpha [Pseudonocardia oceani]MBW0090790.1 molybdenum storage protein subunit alpha [Pseudonocardia oceani]MBW0095753.1 molybdenum storage protein subunit alpha [Pseudonocardia oceani]MBW0108312.1 molybdenum storage protein subunit alpha [Pseudonocardia oceani]MBW0121399.1 molybdenum storage protein subunit alpha [Pseudonocardia oceani]MBW0130083.1 molybdenum storage protein subunit alpha [Pseudonocardia oceani]